MYPFAVYIIYQVDIARVYIHIHCAFQILMQILNHINVDGVDTDPWLQESIHYDAQQSEELQLRTRRKDDGV